MLTFLLHLEIPSLDLSHLTFLCRQLCGFYVHFVVLPHYSLHVHCKNMGNILILYYNIFIGDFRGTVCVFYTTTTPPIYYNIQPFALFTMTIDNWQEVVYHTTVCCDHSLTLVIGGQLIPNVGRMYLYVLLTTVLK